MRPHEPQRAWLRCARRPFVRPITIMAAATTEAESAAERWGSNPLIGPSTVTSSGLTVMSPMGDHPGDPLRLASRTGQAEDRVVVVRASVAGWRTDWRTSTKSPANWHVRVGLENRFGPLGPTRVQIPPPPLDQAVRPTKVHRFLCSAVSETAT